MKESSVIEDSYCCYSNEEAHVLFIYFQTDFLSLENYH